MSTKFKIKKGDQVVVITGKDKGKAGEVLQVNPTDQRVIVKGVNVVKKHIKPTQFNPGGIENVERSIHISNVMHADPKDGTPTRVSFEIGKDGAKTGNRIAKKSGQAIGGAAAAAPKAAAKPAAKKAGKAKE